MLMQGDLNKLIEKHIQPVFDTAFARIEGLEKQVEALNEQLLVAAKEVELLKNPPKRGPGRPKKVNNEEKAA